MKLRTRIANWLYLKYGSKNIVAMTRAQFFGVNLNSGDIDLSELPEPEKLHIAIEAKGISENPVFKMAVDMVKNRFMRHARDLADGELEMFCDRFSINGASMVQEELVRLSGLIVDDRKEAEEPFSMLE